MNFEKETEMGGLAVKKDEILNNVYKGDTGFLMSVSLEGN